MFHLRTDPKTRLPFLYEGPEDGSVLRVVDGVSQMRIVVKPEGVTAYVELEDINAMLELAKVRGRIADDYLAEANKRLARWELQVIRTDAKT